MDDFIDFEIANELNSLGFDFNLDVNIIVDYYYNSEGKEVYWEFLKQDENYIPRIHLYDVSKWLRNHHNINTEIEVSEHGYSYELWDTKQIRIIGGDMYFSSYEIALLNSIKTSINYIKDGKKD